MTSKTTHVQSKNNNKSFLFLGRLQLLYSLKEKNNPVTCAARKVKKARVCDNGTFQTKKSPATIAIGLKILPRKNPLAIEIWQFQAMRRVVTAVGIPTK
jgi:hypothetical protein